MSPSAISQATLLLIDVQDGFKDTSYWGARNNPTAEANMARILNEWRRLELPLIHIQHASTNEKSPLHPEKPGFVIQEVVAPLPGEKVITKGVNSSFIGTTLEADLRARNVQSLLIVGLTTNHCVSTTARMAGNFGFDTFLVRDATATFERLGLDGRMRPAQQVHDGALSDIKDEFATIVTTKDVIESLSA